MITTIFFYFWFAIIIQIRKKENEVLFFQIFTSLIRLAVAHIQIHQLSPGLGALQILSFQFHLCWPVMSQKLAPFPFHDNSLQDVGLSTNLAQTLCVPS